MVVGGYTNSSVPNTWVRIDDIEVVSTDPNTMPVPSCLSELNPFPYGVILYSAGGTAVPGKSVKS